MVYKIWVGKLNGSRVLEGLRHGCEGDFKDEQCSKIAL
jgi:hypothetical protein